MACSGASRASSGRAHRVPGTFLARLGARCSANVVRFFGQGWYRLDQWSKASLFGKVKRTRDECT
jgi:hypothetical protein